MERKKYIRPEIDAIPYGYPLLEITGDPVPGSMGINNEEDILGKEFDFEEESFESDLWASDRQGFGLQDWNEEE